MREFVRFLSPLQRETAGFPLPSPTHLLPFLFPSQKRKIPPPFLRTSPLTRTNPQYYTISLSSLPPSEPIPKMGIPSLPLSLPLSLSSHSLRLIPLHRHITTLSLPFSSFFSCHPTPPPPPLLEGSRLGWGEKKKEEKEDQKEKFHANK